jgi:aminopeptidase-like protein
MVLWALLLKELQSSAHRYTYRFALVPETIGAIAYLSKHQEAMKNVAGGFVLTTNAGPGEFGYKESFLGNSVFDEVVLETFKERNINFKFYPFDIHGSDERQFSSPGFRLPMVTVTKDKYYEYKYYHTSLDDLSFISPAFLIESLSIYLAAIEKLEMNQCYLSLNPFCEPMLSKRDLYSAIGGKIKQYSADGNKSKTQIDAICQLMFHSDGTKDLLEISKKSAIAMEVLDEVAKLLIDKKLLRVAVKG